MIHKWSHLHFQITNPIVFINSGYGVQQESVAAASKKIWTNGCIEIIRVWAERNLYTIAGIALGAALVCHKQFLKKFRFAENYLGIFSCLFVHKFVRN